MDPKKVEAVANWPVPEKKQDIQAFLGFCNFYQQFIPKFATKAHPLNELTRANVPWQWGEKQQHAFDTLKQAFQTQPTLLLPDPNKPFTLETDASLVGTGAVLYQKNEQNELQPCGYISHALNPAQQRYEIYDRELLSLIRALHIWRHYLLHSPEPVTIWTDHKNLTHFQTLQCLTPRQIRWQNILDQYNLDLTHKPGTKMIPSDLLS